MGGNHEGEDAVVKAIEKAMHSEGVDLESVKKASTIIFNITCAPNTVKVSDADNANNLIYSYVTESIDHLFFGYSYVESLGDTIKVTFIATGTEPKTLDGMSKSNSAPTASFTFAPK